MRATKKRCVARVAEWMGYSVGLKIRQCKRPAGHGPGKRYCHIHARMFALREDR